MSDSDSPKLKLCATVPYDDVIKSMVIHKGNLIVATNDTIYICSDKGVFTPIMFEVPEDE